ncbi:uncharacterized protein I206_101172 [Kwoniella pini CBS 10737]|uniref:Ubiquitin carboxyl-terminal hydrolase n=1 Tax=Kwoniella pini CBS 10737 TaxID=1296096 RepID=A0A1B9IB33_9TREE|nr:uncharacterized protein I206_00154 [Kwoniella pini CBS 10737]OCF52855.1 hypothetical protein I206_00154 [Kwoniella pini CBS 10737]
MTTLSQSRPPHSLQLGNENLLQQFLNNPISFSEPIHRQDLKVGDGLRVVKNGPPSPPSTKRSLNGSKKLILSQPGLKDEDNENESEEEEEDGLIKGKSNLPNGLDISDMQKQLPTPATTQPSSSNTLSAASPIKPNLAIQPQSQSLNKSSTLITPKKGYQSTINPDDLYQIPIDLSWPESISSIKRPAAGLNNPGMACYANATLQVLLHTPPVLSIAMEHEEEKCIRSSRHLFCMLCSLKGMATGSHWGKRRTYAPSVHSDLKNIKKGFSKMRQEDTHEFFRFVTDALQLSALAGKPKDLPEKIKHSSWVYKVWGGRVRSRVVCSRCQKPSDTFDWFLDLSLDVNKKGPKSINNMMNGFTREDRLEGDNKYHCDNCKAKANATKSFKIQETPPILTLHLKRFSVEYSRMGRVRANKFNDHIEFPEQLDVAAYMVDPKAAGTKYRLFGVTCHHGTELRHGHYTSYVKGPQNQWFHADDDDVSPVKLVHVLRSRSAYLLSYIRIDENAIPTRTPFSNGISNGNGIASTPSKIGEKRSRSESESEYESESDEENDEKINELKPRKSMNGPMNGNSKPMSIRKATPPLSKTISSPIKSRLIEEERNTQMPPELPSKFGSLLKNKSTPPKIIQPKPVHPQQFYGGDNKSPIQRIPGPPPDSDFIGSEDPSDPISSFSRSDRDREMSKKMKKKDRKAQSKRDKKNKSKGYSHSMLKDNPYKAGSLSRGSKASRWSNMGKK